MGQALSWGRSLPSPAWTLVTPYCKRTRPGRGTNMKAAGFPPLSRRSPAASLLPPFALPHALDPSGLGHAATLTRQPEGPPGLETPTLAFSRPSWTEAWCGCLSVWSCSGWTFFSACVLPPYMYLAVYYCGGQISPGSTRRLEGLAKGFGPIISQSHPFVGQRRNCWRNGPTQDWIDSGPDDSLDLSIIRSFDPILPHDTLRRRN
jgi:hypothetical protein